MHLLYKPAQAAPLEKFSAVPAPQVEQLSNKKTLRGDQGFKMLQLYIIVINNPFPWMVACQHLNGLTLMGILHSLKWIKKDCFSENALLFLLCTVVCLMQHSTCRNRSCMMGHCKEVTSSGALKKFLANWRWPFLNALISQIRVDNDTALILDERRPTAGECSWIWFYSWEQNLWPNSTTILQLSAVPSYAHCLLFMWWVWLDPCCPGWLLSRNVLA